jgi:polyphosphate kinase 2
MSESDSTAPSGETKPAANKPPEQQAAEKKAPAKKAPAAKQPRPKKKDAKEAPAKAKAESKKDKPKKAKSDDKKKAKAAKPKEDKGAKKAKGGKPKKGYKKNGKLQNDYYEEELERMQTELVKLQYWVREKGLRVVALFEGRDAAGKGGAIKRISETLNPRGCHTVALGTPTEREKTQWYFQRYVPHLPAAGEIVLFDRSWYNRAGVERVMGFCTMDQYREFLHSCPLFERMLVRSGIILLKYWFSVSDEEQERRFRSRAATPTKRWKLSPMDLESRSRWVEYSKAKDVMFDYTDITEARWNVVESNDKKRARLNCISHFLSAIPYGDLLPKDKIKFPPRQKDKDYIRPPLDEQNFVPGVY